ncbi:MAG: heparinase II/III family protein [Paracoccaceae bacterium]
MTRGKDRAGDAGGLANRLALWRAAKAPAATAFNSQPEPRTIGLFGRGKQLIAGNLLFAGHLVQAPGRSLWDIAPPDAAYAAELHGFAWLDDLAAVGDHAARSLAQGWTWDWIDRFGAGQGPGWTPDLVGRRLIRWINHALLLLQGCDKARADTYFRALSVQTVFLSRRWKQAAPGLPRFEALTGLISAGLALDGMEGHVARAISALEQDCAREIDAGGGIPTRNPEELLEVFTLLTWAGRALAESGRAAGPALSAAMGRIAPSLRGLRHADGGLARFHGGGRGVEGRLDQALAASGVPVTLPPPVSMGFARLADGRTSLIVDAAPPPAGRASRAAHASTLAFELTSGRRPLIVSCGPGAGFGADWGRAGRATPSHSTLALDGFSSSRLAVDGNELAEIAAVPVMRVIPGEDETIFHAVHTGWAATHGLIHRRDLILSGDGRRLSGLDALSATTPAARRRFEQMMAQGQPEGIGFAIRFHLHPDVDAALDLGGTAVSLALKSGEIWVFRHDGQAVLSLDPSVHLERGRLKPRASRQIVLSARAYDFETRIGWTLAKAQDTPLAIRDLERDDLPVPL